MEEAEWSSLRVEVTKEGINTHYRDFLKAMQLRLFAKALDGWGPCGRSNGGSAKELALQVASQCGL